MAGQVDGLLQPVAHGGSFPRVLAITVGIVTVIFSMTGAEIATIAAAESPEPEKAVAKAANSVILRIADLLRRLGVPAGDDHAVERPDRRRVAVRCGVHRDGDSHADHIMNAVVLTAVLSCLNSGMYTASRMLFVLAARREAPRSWSP